MYEWVTTEFWTHEYIYIHIHTMMMTQMHGLIRTMANMHEGSERWGRGRKKVSPQRCNKLKVISHDKRFSRLLPLTRIILPKKTTNNSGNTFNGWDQKQTLTSFIWLEVALCLRWCQYLALLQLMSPTTSSDGKNAYVFQLRVISCWTRWLNSFGLPSPFQE